MADDTVHELIQGDSTALHELLLEAVSEERGGRLFWKGWDEITREVLHQLRKQIPRVDDHTKLYDRYP
jgi:hypothetical protein